MSNTPVIEWDMCWGDFDSELHAPSIPEAIARMLIRWLEANPTLVHQLNAALNPQPQPER